MGVGNGGVVSSLPALVASNAAVKILAVIAVDGVTEDFGELLVDDRWVGGRWGDGLGVDSKGIGR